MSPRLPLHAEVSAFQHHVLASNQGERPVWRTTGRLRQTGQLFFPEENHVFCHGQSSHSLQKLQWLLILTYFDPIYRPRSSNGSPFNSKVRQCLAQWWSLGVKPWRPWHLQAQQHSTAMGLNIFGMPPFTAILSGEIWTWCSNPMELEAITLFLIKMWDVKMSVWCFFQQVETSESWEPPSIWWFSNLTMDFWNFPRVQQALVSLI